MILCPICRSALFRTGGAAWWCSHCARSWEPLDLQSAAGPDGVQARCVICWQSVPAVRSAGTTHPARCAQHAQAQR